MGNNQSPQQIDCNQWQQIYHNSQNDKHTYPILVRHKKNSNILGYKYYFEACNIDIRKQKNIYDLRKKHHRNIISIYEYKMVQQNWCSLESCSWNIVLEYIPRRLSQINNIISCEGFIQLWNHYKISYPTLNMIGVKDNGDIKVWINEDWSSNDCKEVKNQKLVIQQLIYIIQNKCKQRILQLQMIRKMVNLTFKDVLLTLNNKLYRMIAQGRYHLQQKINKINQQNKNKKKQNKTNINSTKLSSTHQRPSTITNTIQDHHQRKYHSCNINQSNKNYINQSNKHTIYPIVNNVQLIQSVVYHSAQKNRSYSQTFNDSYVQKKQKCVPHNVVINKIKYNKIIKKQNNILFNQEYESQSTTKTQRQKLDGSYNNSKKNINFIYHNQSPYKNNKNNIIYEDNRPSMNKFKIGRQRTKDMLIPKHLQQIQIKRQPKIPSNSNKVSDCNNRIINPREQKNNQYIKYIQNLDISDKRQQFMTPQKNSNDVCSQQVVQQFVYYLRLTPTQKQKQKEQSILQDNNDISNNIIIQRQGQQDD